MIAKRSWSAELDEACDDLAEHVLEIDRRRLQTDLTGLELRDAEQVVGEAGEVLGFEPQLVQALVARILGKAIARVVHEREPRLDLGQRCPQLVGRKHHELALDAVDLTQLGEGRVLELDGPAHLRVALAHQLASEEVAAQRDNEQEEEPRHQRVHERGVEVMVGDVEPDHEVRDTGDERARHAADQPETQAAGDHDDEEGDGQVGVVSAGQIDESARDREVEHDGRHLETAARDAMGEEHHRRREIEHAPGAEHQVDRRGRLAGARPGKLFATAAKMSTIHGSARWSARSRLGGLERASTWSSLRGLRVGRRPAGRSAALVIGARSRLRKLAAQASAMPARHARTVADRLAHSGEPSGGPACQTKVS